ncbi:VanW family protein [Cytobacillus spongiae]|uniref:VanW family protein n=1 Tax=Cytobacillus spongiae TaxID=2901381 RepID=UPI001F2A9693|nr:VanW family protein [Cytobacillus spongiae]UII55051.1 VanW family protein [Cytobacillus spongiae]
MRNQQSIKLFLVLIICTFYIFSFSHFGAFAYDSIMSKDNRFEEGTTIGTTDVAGKLESETLQLIQEQLVSWKANSSVLLKFKEKEQMVDLNLFQFRMDETVNSAKNGQKNLIVVDMDQGELEDIIYAVAIDLSSSNLDMDNLSSDLLLNARMLEVGQLELRLEDYLIDSADEVVVLHESTLEAAASNELNTFIEKASTIEIKPQSQFSFLKFLEDLDMEKLTSKTMNLIATGIYDAILPSNFSIIERHISGDLPSYAKLGFEASVNQDKNLDLVFSNPNEATFSLQFKAAGGKLTVSLIGHSFLNEYKVLKKDETKFKPKEIIQFNPQLKPTDKKLKQEGTEGLLVKVVREVYDDKGALLRTEPISEDFYPPIHRILLQGLIVDKGQSGSSNSNSNSSGSSADEDQTDQDEDGSSPSGDDNSDDEETGNEDSSNDQSGEDNDEDDNLWGKPNEQPK